jgi:F-type H+-transporting ATPase subunit b
LDKLGINLGYLIVQILNFIILFLVVKKWIYTPVLGMLEKRRKMIAEGVENARVAAEERSKAEDQAAKIITEAQAKAAEIVRDATARADSAAQDIKNAADAEAEKIMENAKIDAEKEKENLLERLRPQVSALAISAAQKLVTTALDEQRQRALLADFFSGLKGDNVLVLEGEKVSGKEAEVISALPLTAQEKERINKDLLAKSGAGEIAYRVDPDILGGLIVKIGDRILDGSISGKLGSLRQNLS